MELTMEQKIAMGFQYILNRLSPSSPYGQELARRIAPYPREQKEQLEEELHNLTCLIAHEQEIRALKAEIRRAFMQMKDIRPALRKGREMVLSDLELFELKNFLLYSDKAGRLAGQLTRRTGIRGICYIDTREALDLLDPDGRRIPSFAIYDSYSPELAEIRIRKRQIERQMETAQQDETRWQELREARTREAVREEAAEAEVRQRLTDALLPYFVSIQANAETTGRLDLLFEKQRAAGFGRHSVCPGITEHHLEIRTAENPWVSSVLREKRLEFTPLSITLDYGTGVITGANMGGKSVALQTIALNTWLALCGFYVYAKEAQIPLFDSMMIISEETQSVKRGLSSFGAQIVQVKQMIARIPDQFCFLIMDEFARGTNPEEGAALVRAVTRYLNECRVIALLVTHFDHVAEYARVHYQVAGLRDMDMEQVSREIAAAGEARAVAVIAEHMNYGIFRVEREADCPKDAFRICRLLGLQDEVMDRLMEPRTEDPADSLTAEPQTEDPADGLASEPSGPDASDGAEGEQEHGA
jgi:DNA mismatch repair protein MutS2